MTTRKKPHTIKTTRKQELERRIFWTEHFIGGAIERRRLATRELKALREELRKLEAERDAIK